MQERLFSHSFCVCVHSCAYKAHRMIWRSFRSDWSVIWMDPWINKHFFVYIRWAGICLISHTSKLSYTNWSRLFNDEISLPWRSRLFQNDPTSIHRALAILYQLDNYGSFWSKTPTWRIYDKTPWSWIITLLGYFLLAFLLSPVYVNYYFSSWGPGSPRVLLTVVEIITYYYQNCFIFRIEVL